MAKNSRVVLFALIKDNKILLEKRPNIGYLVPGGGINQLESLEDALKREMMEELNIIPNKFELLTKTDIPGLNNNILKPFIVTSWQGEIPENVLDKEDPHPLEWMDIDKALNSIPVKPTKRVIEVLKEYFLASRSGSRL